MSGHTSGLPSFVDLTRSVSESSGDCKLACEEGRVNSRSSHAISYLILSVDLTFRTREIPHVPSLDLLHHHDHQGALDAGEPMPVYKRSPNFGGPVSYSTVAYEPTRTFSSASTTDSFDFPPPRPTASPPVILAFLAIGLFAAALIALLGYRRVTLERRWLLNQRNGGGLGADVLEIPRLWDLGSTPGAVGLDGGWEDIMVRCRVFFFVWESMRGGVLISCFFACLDSLLRRTT